MECPNNNEIEREPRQLKKSVWARTRQEGSDVVEVVLWLSSAGLLA